LGFNDFTVKKKIANYRAFVSHFCVYTELHTTKMYPKYGRQAEGENAFPGAVTGVFSEKMW
jgi:hypothetical protein